MWQLCLPAQRGVYISTKGLKKFHCTAEFSFCYLEQRNFIWHWEAVAFERVEQPRKMLVFYSDTFAGVDEVENRDTLTNDQPNEQANETPCLQISLFLWNSFGTFSDLVGLLLDLCWTWWHFSWTWWHLTWWDLCRLLLSIVYSRIVCEKCFVITLSLVSQTAAINVSVEMRIPNTK